MQNFGNELIVNTDWEMNCLCHKTGIGAQALNELANWLYVEEQPTEQGKKVQAGVTPIWFLAPTTMCASILNPIIIKQHSYYTILSHKEILSHTITIGSFAISLTRTTHSLIYMRILRRRRNVTKSAMTSLNCHIDSSVIYVIHNQRWHLAGDRRQHIYAANVWWRASELQQSASVSCWKRISHSWLPVSLLYSPHDMLIWMTVIFFYPKQKLLFCICIKDNSQENEEYVMSSAQNALGVCVKHDKDKLRTLVTTNEFL